MSDVLRFDLENPWLFVFTNVVVGIVVVSTIQAVFFGDELTGAVIEGATLGLASGITLFYLRQNNEF